MAKFAVLSDDIVINIIVADSKESAELATGKTCIDCTNESSISIEWTYDGVSFNPPTE